MKPDVAIFNSMIAACAHGGEHAKARAMFDSMAEHGCAPDAVTYANLIRAYKKGGQWCESAISHAVACIRAPCAANAFHTLQDVEALMKYAGRSTKRVDQRLGSRLTFEAPIKHAHYLHDLHPWSCRPAQVCGAGHFRGNAGKRVPPARSSLLQHHRRPLADRHRLGTGQGPAPLHRCRTVRFLHTLASYSDLGTPVCTIAAHISSMQAHWPALVSLQLDVIFVITASNMAGALSVPTDSVLTRSMHALRCCRNGSLPPAAESCKKGTLKLDLQSLTVGVAVVSMAAWLLRARSALLADTPSPLDAARKLAVVNGLGEHSRAQVHCHHCCWCSFLCGQYYVGH